MRAPLSILIAREDADTPVIASELKAFLHAVAIRTYRQRVPYGTQQKADKLVLVK